MWKYFLYLFLIGVIITIAQAPNAILQDFEHSEHQEWFISPGFIFLQLIGVAYFFLVLPVFNYGADLLYLRAMRNEEIKIREMFEGFNNYLNIILAHLLATAIIGLGFIFLIVPGIILACRLVFVPFLVMDKKLEAVVDVEKSWNMTRGHGWKIFGMAILSFFIIILGLLCLFVGVIFSAIWIGTAFTSLYYAIDRLETEALDQNGVV